MSEKRGLSPWKVTGTLSIVAAAAAALYIMPRGLGLIDELDFGAGAYYYADIPSFEKYVNTGSYDNPVPMWVLMLLFFIWGYLMYRLWSWLERRH